MKRKNNPDIIHDDAIPADTAVVSGDLKVGDPVSVYLFQKVIKALIHNISEKRDMETLFLLDFGSHSEKIWFRRSELTKL